MYIIKNIIEKICNEPNYKISIAIDPHHEFNFIINSYSNPLTILALLWTSISIYFKLSTYTMRAFSFKYKYFYYLNYYCDFHEGEYLFSLCYNQVKQISVTENI